MDIHVHPTSGDGFVISIVCPLSELALNVPFIQHPEGWYQSCTGSVSQGLSTARGKCSSLCWGLSDRLLAEGSVNVSANPAKSIVRRRFCPETPIAGVSLSVGKIFCFFPPHPGFSGGNCSVCPPVSWLRELGAFSESFPELPRTAEVFFGSAGQLPCSSGGGQTSFWVPRSRPAKSSDVLGFSPPPYVISAEGMGGSAFFSGMFK